MPRLDDVMELSNTVHVVRAAPRKWELREYEPDGPSRPYTVRVTPFRSARAALLRGLKAAWPQANFSQQ